jgi:hypothetical protein
MKKREIGAHSQSGAYLLENTTVCVQSACVSRKEKSLMGGRRYPRVCCQPYPNQTSNIFCLVENKESHSSKWLSLFFDPAGIVTYGVN